MFGIRVIPLMRRVRFSSLTRTYARRNDRNPVRVPARARKGADAFRDISRRIRQHPILAQGRHVPPAPRKAPHTRRRIPRRAGSTQCDRIVYACLCSPMPMLLAILAYDQARLWRSALLPISCRSTSFPFLFAFFSIISRLFHILSSHLHPFAPSFPSLFTLIEAHIRVFFAPITLPFSLFLSSLPSPLPPPLAPYSRPPLLSLSLRFRSPRRKRLR